MFQRDPLIEEQELVEHLRFDLFAQLIARAIECSGCATNQRRLPLVPGHAVVRIFQCAEECVIVVPVRFALREVFKRAAEIGVGRLFVVLVSAFEQVLLCLMDVSEVHGGDAGT